MMISYPPPPVRPSILVLDGDYPGMDGLVEKILEAHPLPWKGKKILLKPNMLGPYPQEKGITTAKDGKLMQALQQAFFTSGR